MEGKKKARSTVTLIGAIYLALERVADWIGRTTVLEDAGGIPNRIRGIVAPLNKFFDGVGYRDVIFILAMMFLVIINLGTLADIWKWIISRLGRKNNDIEVRSDISSKLNPRIDNQLELPQYFQVPQADRDEALGSAASIGAFARIGGPNNEFLQVQGSEDVVRKVTQAWLDKGLEYRAVVRVRILKAVSNDEGGTTITYKAGTEPIIDRHVAEKWQKAAYCVILETR